MSVFVGMLTWVSGIVFVSMVIYKFINLSRMPLHLRWELYPLAGESQDRRQYGGSYMEEIDWVKKPKHRSLFGEMVEMGSEILFFLRVKEHNPYHIWFFGMVMHWGLYLLFAWLGVLVVNSILNLDILAFLLTPIGFIGFIFGAFGSLGLIYKRISVAGLRMYTTPADIFNLSFQLAIFVTGIFSGLNDTAFSNASQFIHNVIHLDFTPPIASISLIHFCLIDLFFIYMPFSKLFHYIAKYFTWHGMLWDDTFKVKGSPIDHQITAQLTKNRLTWSGPHIITHKTWLEQTEIIKK